MAKKYLPLLLCCFEIHTAVFASAINYPSAKADLCSMQRIKTWLVLGATEGLGPAAVKYLSAHGQHVISINSEELPGALPQLDLKQDSLDYIINNSNYTLFHKEDPDIESSACVTISLLASLTRLLKKDPRGIIFNIPPQLCLATIEDQSAGPELQRRMDFFLHLMREGLNLLGFPLHLIEPGERLF